MNIKIYKKLAIVLTLSFVVFSATGCQSIDNQSMIDKTDSQKDYSISAITEDIASAFKTIASDIIGFTKGFVGDEDFRKQEIEKIKELPQNIKNNINIFEKTSDGIELNEDNGVVKGVSDSYQKVKDSVGGIIDDVKK
ncbi:hypothetical protein GCM10008904_27310 [Paraclostridium ghonii]|uniref:Lipoprotein n=1 Tax=Paraclostridium ghonii TaxID=29358 RepID=A0ABU0MZ91_9FIRM|nr:hypothetical protein [Paeniclostridium ghonii]MDQ0555786.1 hypothetical protein [Paeniclostridium ghonii]